MPGCGDSTSLLCPALLAQEPNALAITQHIHVIFIATLQLSNGLQHTSPSGRCDHGTVAEAPRTCCDEGTDDITHSNMTQELTRQNLHS